MVVTDSGGMYEPRRGYLVLICTNLQNVDMTLAKCIMDLEDTNLVRNYIFGKASLCRRTSKIVNQNSPSKS